MEPQKQLEDTGILREGHSNTQLFAPTFTMVAGGGIQGQPLHPIKHAMQIFIDTSKEGWGAHLDERIARGAWSLPESNLHINYLELKAVFIALIHPIQWIIAYPVGADRPAKRQKKTSCVSTG